MTTTGRPPKQDWPKCKMQGCEGTTQNAGKGFCRTHYMQAYRGALAEDGSLLRAPHRVRSYGPGAHCAAEGCTTRPRSNDLCIKHYQQWKAGTLPDASIVRMVDAAVTRCEISDCNVRAASRGMCPIHARRFESGIIDEEGTKLRDPSLRPGRGWVGKQRGYRKIMMKDHPNADRYGYVLEHRLVVEKMLGRYLESHEIVHHKDGVRDNNDPPNLEVHTRKTHPPAHEYTVEHARQVLQALQFNDPEGCALLLSEFLQ